MGATSGGNTAGNQSAPAPLPQALPVPVPAAAATVAAPPAPLPPGLDPATAEALLKARAAAAKLSGSVTSVVAATHEQLRRIEAQIQDIGRRPIIAPSDTAEKAVQLAELFKQKTELMKKLGMTSAPDAGLPASPIAPLVSPALALAQANAAAQAITGSALGHAREHLAFEIEINDLPQLARYKVTHRETVGEIAEKYGVSLTTKGFYTGPGRPLPAGERKLYIVVEGDDEYQTRLAKREIDRLLLEATKEGLLQEAAREKHTGGRYQVV
eukprot:TRINITY_DN1545_c0_g1_i3.p1 TRINITY_DN1545_c0_g1~~TRINITY_DN1545_c0_g1_i3.p1  ORF type:complete len:270 (+),score=65.85 TRINITY_DN1545_c0_g1_i3:117-926(+)